MNEKRMGEQDVPNPGEGSPHHVMRSEPNQDASRNPHAHNSVSTEQETLSNSPHDATHKSENQDADTQQLEPMSDQDFADEMKRRTEPSEHEKMGGLDAVSAWIMVVLAALGWVSSMALTVATIEHARNPGATLSCDINTYISCGASMESWKSEVLGVPNALLGLVAFTALLTIAVILVAQRTLPRWFWIVMVTASVGALLSVYWFAWQSAFSLQTLCPWCVLVWIVMVALFILIVGHGCRAQIPGFSWLGRSMIRDWWGFAAVMYGLLILIVILGLGSKLFS